MNFTISNLKLWQKKVRPDFSLWLLLLLTSSFWGLDFSNAWAQDKDFVVKTVNLSQYGTAASIDQDPKSRQLVIGFKGCNLLFLDQNLNQESSLLLKDCKTFFRARYGEINSQKLVVSSIYTGKSALYNFQEVLGIPLHNAAVTDSLAIKDYLLSSSDDGSVQIARLLDLKNPQVKRKTLYQSIGVARNLAVVRYPDLNSILVAVSYDSGEIAIFDLSKDIINQPVQPRRFRPFASRINTFEFTRDGSKLLIGYFTGELVELDLQQGTTKTLLKVNSWLNTLDINRQNLVAVGDDQGYVKILSLQTGQVLENHKISSAGITAILFIDEKTVLAVDAAGIAYQGQLRN